MQQQGFHLENDGTKSMKEFPRSWSLVWKVVVFAAIQVVGGERNKRVCKECVCKIWNSSNFLTSFWIVGSKLSNRYPLSEWLRDRAISQSGREVGALSCFRSLAIGPSYLPSLQFMHCFFLFFYIDLISFKKKFDERMDVVQGCTKDLNQYQTIQCEFFRSKPNYF